MPVGPYKTFKECVEAQMKKGRDKKTAQKICGAMEKRSQGIADDLDLDFDEVKRLWDRYER